MQILAISVILVAYPPRCIGDEDIALCSFIKSTNIQVRTSKGGYDGTPIIIKTKHPYQMSDAAKVSQLINIPGAISYSIIFNDRCHLWPGTDILYVLFPDALFICDATQECSSKAVIAPRYGRYTDVSFPGSRGKLPLIIHSSSFHISLEITCRGITCVASGE